MAIRLRAAPTADADGRPAREPRLNRDRTDFVPVAAPDVGEAEAARVADVVRSGFVSSAGPEVARFERALADVCGTEHAVATATGTASLALFLHAVGCGPGDEVIVPALTFISVGWAVRACGARPVYVDVERSSLNATPEAMIAAMSPRTRGAIAVHTFGHPMDVEPVADAMDRRGLFLLEDACEALGATLRGAPIGGLGDAAVHSFYANKTMTTGNGGAVTTNHAPLAAALRRARGYSSEEGYHFWHPERPFNTRMSALQAAVGVAQVGRLGQFVADRRALAARYDATLAGIEGLRLPAPCAHGEATHWMYTVHVEPEAYGQTAAQLRQRLADAGVETRAVFAPLPAQPILRDDEALARCPNARWAAATGINLPSGPHVTEADVARIAAVLRERG